MVWPSTARESSRIECSTHRDPEGIARTASSATTRRERSGGLVVVAACGHVEPGSVRPGSDHKGRLRSKKQRDQCRAARDWTQLQVAGLLSGFVLWHHHLPWGAYTASYTLGPSARAGIKLLGRRIEALDELDELWGGTRIVARHRPLCSSMSHALPCK